MQAEDSAPVPTFLAGGGQMAELIAAHDWSGSLGPVESWPQSLKTVVGLMIHSPVPLVLLWGPDGIMLYNQGYAVFAGNRHPALLGSKVLEGWPEAAELNARVMQTCMAGGTLQFKDLELALNRRGRLEPAWMDLFYSPVIDESGLPGGVIAVVVETTERVLAGRAAIAQRERLAQMFKDAPSFMCHVDGPEHIFSFTNAAYQQLIAHRDVIGKSVREALPELAGQGFYELLDQVYASGKSYRGYSVPVTLQRTPDAAPEKRLLDFIYQPVRNSAGTITGIFTEGYDVTDSVENTRLLAESEERLRIALSAANSVGTWDWDVPSDRVVADAGFAALYGVDPEHAHIGAPIAAFFSGIHPDDVPRVQADIERALASGDLFNSEYRLVQADGSEKWVVARGRSSLSADGKPLRFSGISFDITNRKNAELRREALVKLTDVIRSLDDPGELAFAASSILGETLKASRVSYGTIDHDAETLTVDRDWLAPGVETLAGTLNLRDFGSFVDSLKAGEFIAIPDVDKDLRTAGAAEALKARSAGAFINVPVLERDRLAAVFFVNNATAREWSDEDLSLVREVAERTRTATERLRATAALREANATLEAKIEERTIELQAASEALRQSQKMEAVGQLTGGIAHDFNNLLQGITGALDRIQHRIAAGRIGDLDRFLKAAIESANRAAALTHRLLAFSRRQTLDPRPIDANRLIGGMEELVRRTMGPDIAVEVVGAAGLWPVRIDPSQLENALLNLCINARDAMPEGGKLTIETANKWLDDRVAKERDLPPGQYVSLCVTDTGTGIAPDIIPRVFDPFFTTKPLGQGTGLGLSMIYGFVRQSGGQVRVYSEVHKGTTMCLYFPRYFGEAVEDHDVISDVVEQGFGETVLVVDDEATVRMLIAEVLSEGFYNIIEAADGPSALKILDSERRIDLMITDVGLPGGMNGRQVADAARILRKNLKVLFITGYAENAAVANGHLEPGMEILAKPFAMSTLASKVREMIER